MRILLAALPFSGWLFAVSLQLWITDLLKRANISVLVPMVAVPAAERGDVMSDVAGLMLVVGWTLLCALMAEPTKAAVLLYGVRHQRGAYPALLGWQIVLLVDNVRAHAYDWWIWFTAMIGVGSLRSPMTVEEVAGFRWPWISGIVAILVGLLAFRAFHYIDDQRARMPI